MVGLVVRSDIVLLVARRTAAAGHTVLEVVLVVRHTVDRKVLVLAEVLAVGDRNPDVAVVGRKVVVVGDNQGGLVVDRAVGRSLDLRNVTAWVVVVVGN